MRNTRFPLLLTLLAAMGCESPDEHVPAGGAPPVIGGTLELTRIDGHDVAVASDPARSSVYVVDLTDGAERHRVLFPEAEPGRVAILGDAAYVVLRRTGEIATISLRTGQILERREACAAPRGIDVDPDDGDLWVACAEGTLLRMPPADGGPSRRVPLLPDLRDVIARGGGEVWVSRFRAAEVIVVRDGVMVGEPHAIPAIESESFDGFTGEPVPIVFDATVAWRMRQTSDGQVILVHQLAQSTPIQQDPRGGGESVSYGGGGGFGCELGGGGALKTAVSVFDGARFSTLTAAGATLSVDGDVSGGTLALAAASEPAAPSDDDDFAPPVNGVRGVPLSFDGSFTPTGQPCFGSSTNFDAHRPATAVAALGDGRFVAQYRDPGELVIGRVQADPFGGPGFGDVGGSEVQARIALSGGRVENLGHALFHEATPSGAACASCHPEGGDDGHVWRFAFGPRRSQHLRGGILDSAPFHWNGEHGTFADLFDDTFVERMGGGVRPRDEEIEQFGQWLDRVPSVPGVVASAERVDRGSRIFRDAGCDSCHNAGAIRDGTRADLGIVDDVDPSLRTREFQVPALRDMVYRAPYLHDGSAATLEEAVLVMPHGDELTERDRGDLIAYLESI